MVGVVECLVGPLCCLTGGNYSQSHSGLSLWESLNLGVPGVTPIEEGESLLGLWDSQVQVCCGAGQHALQAGQVSQMGWARGSVSMETCSLYIGSSGLGPAACFSSGPSEFTAWSLGASELLSACHRPGHWVLVLPRKQASDLGSCVFPASVVNYSGLTGGF